MAQVEIAIAMFDSSNLRGARVGDIIDVRLARGEMGQKERRLAIWAILQGPSDEVLLGLKVGRANGDKYRYKIRDAVLDSIDMDRGMDMDNEYQPFLSFNEFGEYVPVESPFSYSVDVVDKGE